jgi:transposase-like protein
MAGTKKRRRRTHSTALKAEVLAACAEPGASVAAVAMAHGLNTNLVHKWRRQAPRASGKSPLAITAGLLPRAQRRTSVPTSETTVITCRIAS